MRINNYEPRPRIPEELITVTELNACTGLDENEQSIGVSKIFTPDEKNILACGYLQTNQPLTVSVRWYHEDKSIFREVINGVQGRFVSRINPALESFPEGDYQIHLSIGRAIVWRTKFRVEQ